MTRNRTIAAILLAAPALYAQGGLAAFPQSWRGLEIRFLTKIEPSGTVLPGGIAVESSRVHHGITDNVHKLEFGYDIALDPAADGKSAQIRIERSATKARAAVDSQWTFLFLPKYPVIPNVKVGDTVALDLLVNPATGQRIVDYLTLARHGDMYRQREPRDFQLTDAEMSMIAPRILIDGKPLADLSSGGVSGVLIWLYISGRGRYILSLAPNDKFGFRKNGMVSEYGFLFHDGASEIRVECQARVAPGSGVFNLYVLHEPDWQLHLPDPWRIGSADRPEFVVGQN
jgi:hypothetical protein